MLPDTKIAVRVREVGTGIYHEGEYGIFTRKKYFLFKGGNLDPFTSLTHAEAVQLKAALNSIGELA